MNRDARITLYGGVPIGMAVTAVALFCDCMALAATGPALIGAALAVAIGFDAVLPDGEDGKPEDK